MGKLHFLAVGCGDTSIIKTSTETFMIDCYNIDQHTDLLPRNKYIKALFITHQHYDHFLGMEYLKDNNYSIEYLIYSPYDRRSGDNSVEYDEWKQFNNYAEYFKNKGSKIYKPYRQTSFEKPWWETNGLKFRMIGPNMSIGQSETRELHDACLVIHVSMGNRRCCFTGDASDTSLNWIVNNTNNYCNDILHASHHGSLNGADLDFIKNAKAKYTIVSTKSGVHESVPHPTALKRYKDNTEKEVYRTDIEGNIEWDY
jgi:beta-lactamase superfamily II metal-dependent hydrolase